MNGLFIILFFLFFNLIFFSRYLCTLQYGIRDKVYAKSAIRGSTTTTSFEYLIILKLAVTRGFARLDIVYSYYNISPFLTKSIQPFER